jgi:ribosomal protein L28
LVIEKALQMCFNLSAMAKVCQICGKGYQKGNQVPRGIGRRVTRRSIIKQQPNLRTKKLTVDGRNVTLRICTSCLKRLKYNENQAAALSEVGVLAETKA